MRNRPNEQDLIEILMPNIRDRIANFIFSSTIKSIRELRDACRRAEILLATRDVRPRKNVSEVDYRSQERFEGESNREDNFYDVGEDDFSIAAIQQNKSNMLFNKKVSVPQKHYEKEKQNFRGNDNKKEENNHKATCPSSFHTMTCFSCGQGNISFKCAQCMGNVQVGSTPGSQLPTKTQLPGNTNPSEK